MDGDTLTLHDSSPPYIPHFGGGGGGVPGITDSYNREFSYANTYQIP